MNILRIILRSLWYYRKPWTAVLAAMATSTAVLTAALIVGDSVRMSLEKMTLNRLGKTEYALSTGDRFFRAELATGIGKGTGLHTAPALIVRGVAVNPDRNTRIPSAEVVGIDRRFGALFGLRDPAPGPGEALISRNTAERLGLKPGDLFLLRLDKVTFAPQNAPFVAGKQPWLPLRLTVKTILSGDAMGSFSLKANQVEPFNIFVDREALSSLLEMPGKANLILVAGEDENSPSDSMLVRAVEHAWQPDDIGLYTRNTLRRGEKEILSHRIFISNTIADAIRKIIPEARPILTYMVNTLSANGKNTPYSFVTATDESFAGRSFEDKGIIVNRWLADDLDLRSGDSMRLIWYRMGALRTIREDSALFRVLDIVPVPGDLADPGLMPSFPGIGSKISCRTWETGAPIDLDRIRDKDENYWKQYQGTPKAFIALEQGEKMWQNPFGTLTAFRFPLKNSDTALLAQKIMAELHPASQGFVFEPVRQQGLQSARQSTDFGELFLSLSFFIIVAGLLLTVLAFSLFLNRRMPEAAIMVSSGFKIKFVTGLFFGETMMVATAGSILGIFGGILLCHLLLAGLNTLWIDAVRTSGITIGLLPGTLVTGFVSGLVVTLLATWMTLWRQLRRPLIPMIRSGGFSLPRTGRSPQPWMSALSLIMICTGMGLVFPQLFSGNYEETTLFLLSGGVLLGGMLLGCYRLLRYSLKRTRIMSAISMLALGTFAVIVTGANRQSGWKPDQGRISGTGGFLFWAESTLPVMYDPNTPEGKKALGLDDEPVLEEVFFLPMQRLNRQDASCLNLNRAAQPSLLAVDPEQLDRIKAFTFETFDSRFDRDHPWQCLSGEEQPGLVPAVADQTVIQWGLGMKLGDTLVYTDEEGDPMRLQLTGGLANSIFQGNVLIADDPFRSHFPSVRGATIMLIDGPAGNQEEIRERLETLLVDYGMVLTPAGERLAAFNSVQNTYLDVFMMLSGLGIILGTVGFGILVARNILERRGELALRLALGFRRRDLMKILLHENLLILAAGLLTGISSAFLTILPALFSPAYSVPYVSLLIILLLIILSGMLWIWIPARRVLREELMQTLREEG